MPVKLCPVCRIEVPRGRYHFHRKVYCSRKCKMRAVETRRKRVPLVRRAEAMLRKHGMTLDDFDALWIEQIGLCAICHLPLPRDDRDISIDHNHETGVVRGLLCFRCNIGIGFFRDDPVAIGRAVSYLEVTQ